MANSRNSVNACQVCDSEGILLGVLGNKVHLYCRNCGSNFHVAYDATWKDLVTVQTAEYGDLAQRLGLSSGEFDE